MTRYLASRTITFGFLTVLGALALDVFALHVGNEPVGAYLAVGPTYLGVLGARQWRKRHVLEQGEASR